MVWELLGSIKNESWKGSEDLYLLGKFIVVNTF